MKILITLIMLGAIGIPSLHAKDAFGGPQNVARIFCGKDKTIKPVLFKDETDTDGFWFRCKSDHELPMSAIVIGGTLYTTTRFHGRPAPVLSTKEFDPGDTRWINMVETYRYVPVGNALQKAFRYIQGGQ